MQRIKEVKIMFNNKKQLFCSNNLSFETKKKIIKSCIWIEWELRLDYGRSPHAYVNQRLQIQLELLMMSGMPLETCWAFNDRLNNKFYYKVASCWLFLLSLTYYDERIHEY
jgi:hypothetical protein